MQLMLEGELASWWWSISVGVWIAYVPRLILVKLPLNIPKTWIHCWIWGDGHHPSYDPFGRPFSAGYHPDLFKVAGTEIMPGYRAVLEGVQADQDFCKIIFGLQYIMERNHVVTIAGPGWFNGHPVILHMVNQMTRMTCTPTLLEMRVGRILAVSCCNVLIYCVTVVDWIPAPSKK